MLSTQTAVVLDALVSVWTAALPDVEVVDGQPLQTQLHAHDVLIVGFSPSRVAVEIEQVESDMAANRDETLSIVCLASSWQGDTAMHVVRARAVEVLDEARAALLEDPELGGVVASCELGFEMALDQAQSADGATATVEFTVRALTL